MSGTQRNPLLFEQRSNNPLQSGYRPLSLADAWSYNAGVVGDWLAKQRAQSAAMGLWDDAAGTPTKAGVLDVAKHYAGGLVAGTKAPRGVRAPNLPIRAASEDVGQTMDATFKYGLDMGPATMPIGNLAGGVAMDNPAQAARVSALAKKMTGDGGFISRLIVDSKGNVVEGQHRLEALRKLGVTNVPVHKIKDLAADVDHIALEDAVRAAQRMHSDQSTQLIRELLLAVDDAGSAAAVREAFEPPVGYEKAWAAALAKLEGR